MACSAQHTRWLCYPRQFSCSESLAQQVEDRQITTTVNTQGPNVRMHSAEWKRLMDGAPVEINPSVGTGMRIMSVEEWSARWKRNEDYPDCLKCGGTNTKEHAFTQTWCRGFRCWESDCLCLDCHAFSLRQYQDPEFKTPEQWEVAFWTEAVHRTDGQHGSLVQVP